MTLIVPEYVLRQREAKKKADEATKELSLKDRVPKPWVANISHAIHG